MVQATTDDAATCGAVTETDELRLRECIRPACQKVADAVCDLIVEAGSDANALAEIKSEVPKALEEALMPIFVKMLSDAFQDIDRMDTAILENLAKTFEGIEGLMSGKEIATVMRDVARAKSNDDRPDASPATGGGLNQGEGVDGRGR